MVKSMLCNYLKWGIAPFLLSVPAYAATKAVDNGSGDTIFWLVITVILTLIFAKQGFIKMLISSPVFLIGFIILMIAAYVIFTAIMIVIGIDQAIDAGVNNVTEFIKGIL